jgi:hypothetical protein
VLVTGLVATDIRRGLRGPGANESALDVQQSGVGVGEDGEHAAVAVFAVGDVELGEDVADVSFEGAFADHE